MSPVANPQLRGKLVTLFGGGGFLGRNAAQALMQAGARVRIVGRSPARAHAIAALGDLGQVQFVAADASDAAAAKRAATGSAAVVNFIGILKGDFERAHVVTPHHIAEAAAASSAAMIQVSAIGADAGSPSAYGRSKACGEAAVRSVLPAATILRPSIVFGRGDSFINRFASLLKLAPIMPVVAPDARFQPVFVGDVAEAIVAALNDPLAHAGATYELGGPQVFRMRALFEWIAAQIGREPLLIDVPDGIAGALAGAIGWLPGAPITKDQWAMLARDTVVASGAKRLSDLGIAATPLDAVAEGWLDVYRRHGRFAKKAANGRTTGEASAA